MKIPTEFYLGSLKINILKDNSLTHHDALGLSTNSQNEIRYCTKFNGVKIPDSVIEQSLCHEAVHQILYKMNEFELNENEKFVQTFSLLLHQAIKSLK